MLDPARYRAARDLFGRLVSLPSDARVRALAEVADPELRDEVAGLLAADEDPRDLDVLALPARAPDRVGPYRVLRELGRGATGVVYEAEEAAPRRRVALKILHPALRTPAFEALVRREAQTLSDAHHPGIPSVFALLDTEVGPVVVMERVDGPRLHDAIAGRARDQRLELLARVCDAVDFAHRRGIVHRDLKPANILVTADGQPKVLDFGIAWSPGAEGDGAPARAGTPAYMPPEQGRGEPATCAADVYALGVMLRELVEPLREDARAVAARATAPDPRARYPDAGALAAELRRCVANRPVEALAGAPLPRLRAALRRHPRAAWAAALLGIAAAWAPWGVVAAADALRETGAEARLARIEGDPADPAVEARLREALADPDVVGTRAAARWWGRLASVATDASRLEPLAAAWVYAEEGDPAPAEALAGELVRRGRPAAALAVSQRGDDRRSLRAALARWDLAGAADALAASERGAPASTGEAAGADGRRAGALPHVLRALAAAAGTGPAPDGGSLAAGRELRGGRITRGAAVELELPGRAKGVAPLGKRLLAWIHGPGAWLDGAPVELPGEPTDVAVADLDGDASPEAVVAVRFGHPGVYVLRGGDVRPLHAGTVHQELPTRAVHAADLDGDGRPEVIAAATGWRGHEVRVFGHETGADAWSVRARARLAAWDVTVARDGRIWVLGGPLPKEAAPVGERRWLVPFTWSGGRLVAGPALRLERDATAVHAADLDGDGADELVLADDTFLGLVDPEGGEAWLPDVTLLDVGQADDDPPAEVWVAAGGAGWVLGGGRDALPTRAAPVLPEVPVPARVAHPRAWRRAAGLVELGVVEEVAGRLAELVDASDGDEGVARAALDALAPGGRTPPAAAGSVAARLLARPELGPAARERAVEVARRAHAFSRDALAPRERLDFTAPLPAALQLGRPGTARRNTYAGRLALDLAGDDPDALVVPLAPAGDTLCVDVDLDVREMDWSAGLELRLRWGDDVTEARMWRIGGGPRAGHHLALTGPDEDTTGRVPFDLGARTVSLCASSGPGAASVALGALPRQVVAREGRAFGPLARLEIGPFDKPDLDPDRRVRVDLAAIRVYGGRFGEGGGDAVARGYAEGAPASIARVAAEGSPLERALARVEAGGAASVAGLAPRDVCWLLRLDPATWAAVVPREVRAARFVEAWETALAYADPWAEEAVRLPALAAVAADDPALALARAESLLRAGRGSAVPALPDGAYTAALLRARLALRAGRREEASAALLAQLATDPAPERVRDAIADDPELAPLVEGLGEAEVVEVR